MADSPATMTPAERQMRQVHEIASRENFQKDMQDFYQSWSGSYDEDMNSDVYTGPIDVARALDKVLSDKNAPILDCASGTGKAGEELAKRGFKCIDAVDFSQSSLDVSASKGVYTRLICDKVGKNKIKGVEDGYYTSLVCSGTISIGHLTEEAFPEWNRIVKKGGFIVFTRSKLLFPDGSTKHPHTMDKIQEAIDDLIQKGVWELVEKVPVEKFFLHYGADVYTLRRL